MKKRETRKLPKTTGKFPQIKIYDSPKQKHPVNSNTIGKKKTYQAQHHKTCEHQGKENPKSFQREIRMALNFLIITVMLKNGGQGDYLIQQENSISIIKNANTKNRF